MVENDFSFQDLEVSIGSLFEILEGARLRLRYVGDEGRFSVRGLETREVKKVITIGYLLDRLSPELWARRTELLAAGLLEIVEPTPPKKDRFTKSKRKTPLGQETLPYSDN